MPPKNPYGIPSRLNGKQNPKYKAAYTAANGPAIVASNARRRAGYKAAAIEHYGGKCSCCGESRVEFLTFDHIGGGGAAHRKRETSAVNICAWLVTRGFPTGFRILCWNCNCAEHYSKGCPHRKEKIYATHVEAIRPKPNFTSTRLAEQNRGAILEAEKPVHRGNLIPLEEALESESETLPEADDPGGRF